MEGNEREAQYGRAIDGEHPFRVDGEGNESQVVYESLLSRG